jgi:2-iminobutanoate/2-iminopropanoate deaminase
MTDATDREPLRQYLKRDRAQARGYSQAVVTAGGRTVWLAGQVAPEDAAGRSLAGDFDGQVGEVFARLGQTLSELGGALADMVTMTVFITDARYGDRFTQLRREIFGDGFPASALITVAGLARPELLVEIQGVAVIG